MGDEPPFSLGRPERRGAVLGWRPGQALAVAVAALGFLFGLSLHDAAGAVLGVLVALAGGAVATVPVRGRGLDEWVPVVASFAVRLRGGALSPGASVEAPPDAPAHLRWPDGRTTVVASVRHDGLRALDDDPRRFATSVASWLRGLSDEAGGRWTVSLLCGSRVGTQPSGAPWSSPGCRVVDHVALSTDDRPQELASMLTRAGVTGVAPLQPDELCELFASRVAPAAGSLLDCDVAARWRLLEGPASVHAAFLVEEWPAGAVDEQLLAPLCVSSDRRTVAVHVGVEELHRARERAARLRTGTAADRAVTAAGGFLASAEAARDDARDAERAAELAAGHGSLRVLCVVSLDARDTLELEAAAARLHADATACGVRLRRCDGDHRRGVLCSVPGWCVP